MTAIRAVIFDLGHTVWDFAPTANARRLNVLRLQQRLEDALDLEVPPPGVLDDALLASSKRWFREWYDDPARLEQPPSSGIITQAIAPLGLHPAPDVLDDLTRIIYGTEVDMPVIEPDTLAAIATLDARGLTMGCVTNTILLPEGITDAIDRLGLRRYFRSVVVSSEMGYRKPHSSLFLRAAEELAVAPEEALFVGDRVVDDVGGAQAVGMRGVLTHQYRQEPLDGAAVTPDAVIQRLAELPSLALLRNGG
ncbi:MAG: HAD family hydrolase [Chloroflexi bacterium]|nr:HAD family hydrolase [Chloroflexota bacterium]